MPERVALRSQQRQKLAEAIQRHAAAEDRVQRVTSAQDRLSRQLFDVFLPAVAEAETALAQAREQAPRMLVTSLLDDRPPTRSTVADAELELRRAEEAVAEARQASQLLTAEAHEANLGLQGARDRLDAAVRAAVSADPARDTLVAEFNRSCRRTLQLAWALTTAGVIIRDISADDLGTFLHIGNLAQSGPVGSVSASRSDPIWAAAIARLRVDPDAELPGLPEPEVPDGGDEDPPRAA
jgi:hypothetical protein